MAYQTGTATDADDLLAKLHSFAVAQGWTVNNYVAGTAYDTVLQISSGSCFANIVSDARTEWAYYFGVNQYGPHKTIRMKLSTAYDGAKAWWDQPSTHSVDMIANHMIGPFPSYHLFGNSQYLHLVVERTSGEFDHIVIGEIDKTATFTGGAYGAISWWTHQVTRIDDPYQGYHTLPFDGNNNQAGAERTNILFPYDGQTWRELADNHTVGGRGTPLFRGSYMMEPLIANAPNDTNGLTPLLPIPVIAERPSSRWAPLGFVPDMRLLNIKNLQPGDSVFLGPDEWVVFPAKAKKEPSLRDGKPNSGWYGYAYKKVV